MNYHNLRAANVARQQEWDGTGYANNDDWRVNELMGEAGEVCNVLKKMHRERVGVRGSRADKEMLAQEIADVVICLDLFLMTRGVAPSVPSIFSAEPRESLTGLGRKLFSDVARLDTVCYFPDNDVWQAANAIHTRCLTLANLEGFDLDMAVAAKFNSTTAKVGLTTTLRSDRTDTPTDVPVMRHENIAGEMDRIKKHTGRVGD